MLPSSAAPAAFGRMAMQKHQKFRSNKLRKRASVLYVEADPFLKERLESPRSSFLWPLSSFLRLPNPNYVVSPQTSVLHMLGVARKSRGLWRCCRSGLGSEARRREVHTSCFLALGLKSLFLPRCGLELGISPSPELKSVRSARLHQVHYQSHVLQTAKLKTLNP